MRIFRPMPLVWSVMILLSCLPAVQSAPVAPVVDGKSAIVVDSVTGKVLYEKNCHLRRPPASTTKLMTAILALEHGRLTERVVASKHACETQFCSLHLKPGEVLTFMDLMKGLLIRSANDSAVCIAEHVGGTEANFVAMMNKKARLIGARETHFVHPHGLYDPKHYSTAYDLAIMARYAVRFPEFNRIVKLRVAKISRSLNDKDIVLKNTARFIWKYPGADGIKTGYTKEAGRCFVGSATRGGWRVISVVLGSKEAGQDTAALMDYAFKFFKPIVFAKAGQTIRSVDVRGGTERSVRLVAKDGLGTVVRKDDQPRVTSTVTLDRVVVPIRKGQAFGVLHGFLNGREIGSTKLVAAESIERSLAASIWFWFSRVVLGLLLIIVGLLIYGTAAAKVARRRRRRLTKRS